MNKKVTITSECLVHDEQHIFSSLVALSLSLSHSQVCIRHHFSRYLVFKSSFFTLHNFRKFSLPFRLTPPRGPMELSQGSFQTHHQHQNYPSTHWYYQRFPATSHHPHHHHPAATSQLHPSSFTTSHHHAHKVITLQLISKKIH